MSGIEMCRRLRETPATRFAHITMMLDNDDSELKTRALLSGADDYLLGPANVDRLAVRLQRYRRSKAKPAPSVTLRSSDLQVDLGAMRVRHRDKRISLIGILGKDDAGIDERTVDVWVGRLRRALKAQGVPDMLRTVRAMGYVFDGS
jgi:two-component system phosphate regulon response regulator PhoB